MSGGCWREPSGGGCRVSARGAAAAGVVISPVGLSMCRRRRGAVFSVSADPSFNLWQAGASFGEARGLARLGVWRDHRRSWTPIPRRQGCGSECKRQWIRPVDEGPNPSGLL